MLAAHTNHLRNIILYVSVFLSTLFCLPITFLLMRHDVPVQVRPATPIFGRLLGNVPVVDYTDF